jgi:hypothetical protein
MATATKATALLYCLFRADAALTCDTFDLHLEIYKRGMQAASLGRRQAFDPPVFNPVLRQHAQALFF